MSNILSYREGNLIEYSGRLGHQHAIVKSVELLQDGREMYSLDKLNFLEDGFVGYTPEDIVFFLQAENANSINSELKNLIIVLQMRCQCTKV